MGMMVMKKKKKKEMDMGQYDDWGYITKDKKKKTDKHFFGHMKVQTLF